MQHPIRFMGLLFLAALCSLALFVTASAAPDQPTIVGGQDVPDPNPYVWQVRLLVTNIPTDQGKATSFCGGSIITEQWILTAAHCTFVSLDQKEIQFIDLCAPQNLSFLQNNVFVVVGSRVLSKATRENIFSVNKCTHHPGYTRNSFDNDVAVMELARAIPNASASIVPLMTGLREINLGSSGTPATVTGWGNTIAGQFSQSDVLRFLKVHIVSNEICQANFTGDFNAQTMVCAGTEQKGKNSCQGDSGGPLVVQDSHKNFVQIGIVSFGAGICDSIGLSVYARVSSFVPWILETIGSAAPDLVVQNLVVTSNNVQVVIKNQGTAAVPANQGFWVDVYIDPKQAPTQVNDVWNSRKLASKAGLVWGVDSPDLSLRPGDALTLTIGDRFYQPKLSLFSGTILTGTAVYAQVDSANANSDDGGVRETHELLGAAYNNIRGPVAVDASAVVANNLLYLPLVTGSNAAMASSAAASASNPGNSPATNVLPLRTFTAQEK